MKRFVGYLAGLLALLLIACGGGKSGGGAAAGAAKSASAVFTVQWPASDARFIANRATRVSMTILRTSNYTSTGSGGVDRPASGTTSQIKIADLPADEPLRITVTATDASGTVLSSASETDTLKPGANTLAFTLASVVDSIVITPASPTVAVGATLQLSAVGKSGGATVLSDASDFVWSSSSNAATVDAKTGLVTGVANGTATITAREAGNDSSSAHTATLVVTVGSGGGTTGGGTSGSTGGTTGNGTVINLTGYAPLSQATATSPFTVALYNYSSPPLGSITSGVVSLNTTINPGTFVLTNGTDTLTISIPPKLELYAGYSQVTNGSGQFASFVGKLVMITTNDTTSYFISVQTVQD